MRGVDACRRANRGWSWQGDQQRQYEEQAQPVTEGLERGGRFDLDGVRVGIGVFEVHDATTGLVMTGVNVPGATPQALQRHDQAQQSDEASVAC